MGPLFPKRPRKRGRRSEDTRQPVVHLEDNRIVFDAKINSMSHRDFMLVQHEVQRSGIDKVTLDFSSCDRAFADGMLPIICGVEAMRERGQKVSVILPRDSSLQRLFTNTSWAHYLDPDIHQPSNTAFDRHMAVHRFVAFEEQRAIVNEVLDVAMRTMSMARDVLEGLEWSFNEVTDNVLNHSQAPTGGLVQVTTYRDQGLVGFVVADRGQGILRSMREGYPDLASDKHAIGEAIKAGITRNPDVGQGNGLAGSLRIATLSGGSFALTSGTAQLVVQAYKHNTDSKSFERRREQSFQGTLVSAFIKQNSDFKMADALAFPGYQHARFDIIDAKYENEDGSALIVRMRDETSGFGTRGAGRQVRTKCENLLDAETAMPMLLDWSGVPVISSSFADEFVGKLFVALGPLAFMARVRNVGMEALVRGLVDKAILQRSAQAARNHGHP